MLTPTLSTTWAVRYGFLDDTVQTFYETVAAIVVGRHFMAFDAAGDRLVRGTGGIKKGLAQHKKKGPVQPVNAKFINKGN